MQGQTDVKAEIVIKYLKCFISKLVLYMFGPSFLTFQGWKKLDIMYFNMCWTETMVITFATQVMLKMIDGDFMQKRINNLIEDAY